MQRAHVRCEIKNHTYYRANPEKQKGYISAMSNDVLSMGIVLLISSTILIIHCSWSIVLFTNQTKVVWRCHLFFLSKWRYHLKSYKTQRNKNSSHWNKHKLSLHIPHGFHHTNNPLFFIHNFHQICNSMAYDCWGIVFFKVWQSCYLAGTKEMWGREHVWQREWISNKGCVCVCV